MSNAFVKTYLLKPNNVEAVLLQPGNMDCAAKWSGGTVLRVANPAETSDVYMAMKYATLDGVKQAEVGDYLLRDTDGRFETMKKSEFEEKYKERGQRIKDE